MVVYYCVNNARLQCVFIWTVKLSQTHSHTKIYTHCTRWDISSWSRWWTVFLLARWQPNCTELTMKHWSYSHPSLSCPPPLLYVYSLSLSCLHSHEECRQVGLICCIGHCQSSSLSCGNRSLMISGLRLSCLCYIYFGCWAAPPLAVPSAFCVFLPLYQILTEIIGVFK